MLRPKAHIALFKILTCLPRILLNPLVSPEKVACYTKPYHAHYDPGNSRALFTMHDGKYYRYPAARHNNSDGRKYKTDFYQCRNLWHAVRHIPRHSMPSMDRRNPAI